MKLRDYQIDLSDQATVKLQKYKFVILSMEVRTWKTITALETIKKYWAKNILFLTKKKAISWIQEDCKHYLQDFNIIVYNYESLHKVKWDFDLIVLDESHGISSFPKPWLKYKNIKKRFWSHPMILLTGTLSTESYSQYFHQIHVSKHTVWDKYKNFYKWVNDWYVKVKQIKTSYWRANCYKTANYDKIMQDVGHYILTFTQKEAWFTTKVDEKILYVKMKPYTYQLVKQLQTDKIIEGKEEVILADTMVKEKQKIHQIFSWTIKFESGNTMILDDSKAKFIKEKFKWKKIGIYYNFKAEKELLFKIFGQEITDDLQVFNTTDKNIALQIVSWREGISLKEADYLVFYNIAFSALSYWQARDRLTTMDRKFNTVYWIFSEGWLEDSIYKAVLKKKDFTTKLYSKEIKNVI